MAKMLWLETEMLWLLTKVGWNINVLGSVVNPPPGKICDKFDENRFTGIEFFFESLCSIYLKINSKCAKMNNTLNIRFWIQIYFIIIYGSYVPSLNKISSPVPKRISRGKEGGSEFGGNWVFRGVQWDLNSYLSIFITYLE